MSDELKKAKMRVISNLMVPFMLAGGGPRYGIDDTRRCAPTECKDKEEIPGREHKGMYSQSKKLRKGAGHKKLTRAERKKRI